jgi:aminopeptidase N
VSVRLIALLSMLAFVAPAGAAAQAGDTTHYTHADSLRGSNGPGREWWDVAFYDLHVRVNPADSSVAGHDAITYRVRRPSQEMQLDLQAPLVMDSVVQEGRRLALRRDGNAYFVTLVGRQRAGDVKLVTAFYHGQPGRGRPAPWSSGFVWARDSLGAPWAATSDEGPGASIWWPLKDYLGDEPDSQRIVVTVPDSMTDVSNGRLRSTTRNADGTTTWEWFVSGPINTYGVAVNAGYYAHYADTLAGEAGTLTLDLWPLALHLDAARRQWPQVVPMLQCFEHWFGPYPWYGDGYKLIEDPYLGMEHQSGIAYGNHFANGYLGRDLSGTGLGLQWDYIIVHESAHEWFGNNISVADYADMWVHEAFATYAEGLYTECRSGKLAGAAYLVGLRKGIQNARPIVGASGVASRSGNDMYFKGANVLLTIRQLVDDDVRWRGILRGLNHTYRHRTVTGRQVEDYIGREAGLDLGTVFAQYFTTTRIPELEYKVEGATLSYRWTNVVPGFDMPVRVQVPGLGTRTLHATEAWQTLALQGPGPAELTVDESFYVTARNVNAAAADSSARR